MRLEIRRVASRELQKALRPLRRVQRQVKGLRLDTRAQRRALASVERRIGRLRERVQGGRPLGGAGRRGRPLSGSSIRALRDRLRMTREQFANVVGVSPGSIFGWETGRTAPRDRSLNRVQELRKMGVRKARARFQTAAPARKRAVRRMRRGRRRAA